MIFEIWGVQFNPEFILELPKEERQNMDIEGPILYLGKYEASNFDDAVEAWTSEGKPYGNENCQLFATKEEAINFEKELCPEKNYELWTVDHNKKIPLFLGTYRAKCKDQAIRIWKKRNPDLAARGRLAFFTNEVQVNEFIKYIDIKARETVEVDTNPDCTPSGFNSELIIRTLQEARKPVLEKWVNKLPQSKPIEFQINNK